VLAEAYLDSGDALRAAELADRAVDEAATMNNRVDMVGALRVRGAALAGQGRGEEGTAVLEKALSLARSMPYPYAEGKVLREQGMLHLHEGAEGQARERFSAALEVFRRLGADKDAGRTLQALEEGAERFR
jgi:tetratricopeptide (TPR) repeat protein